MNTLNTTPFGKLKNNLLRLIKEPFLLITIIIVFALLFVFVLFPVLKVIQYSLFQTSDTNGKNLFSPDAYKYIFTHKRFFNAIFNSVLLGTIVATAATAIGFIFAYAMARIRLPGSGVIKNLLIIPMISPPFMFALSVILLFGRNGLITAGLLGIDRFNIYGLPGLVLVGIVSRFPLAYLTLFGIIRAIDPDLETCAHNLGARSVKTFFSVTLPLTMPGIFASWLLVFVNCLTDFGNPMIIGGNFDVLSVQAYLEFTGMGNLPRGCGLAILLLIPSFLIFFLQKYIVGKKSYVTITGKTNRRTLIEPKPGMKIALLTFCGIIISFVLLLYLTIIAGCFINLWGLDWTPTLKWFTYSFDVGLKTLCDTLALTVLATPVAALMGMFIAFLVVRKKFPGRRFLEGFAMLSYAIPGTAMGIGYILAFNEPPLLLTGTAVIIVACYIFRYLPVSAESGIASLKQISGDIEESSTNLGAKTPYTFRHVTLPLIVPSFFTGMIYTFIKCATAISAVIFLVSGSWKHLTVLTLAQTENMRLGAASVLSTVLIVIIMIAMVIVKKITGLDKRNAFSKQD
jgi:iron(III) transport system permease protein